MSFKSHIPFYRQMSGALVFIFCFLLFVFSVTTVLLYQRNAQINDLVNVQIPQIEFTNKYNQLLRENNSLTLALPKSETATELNRVFTQLQLNVNNIAELYSNKLQQMNKFTSEIKSIENTLMRIKGNDALNVTLKSTAMDEIDTLTKILVNEIEAKTKEQASLSRLVANSGSYIYSGQANAYISSIESVIQLNKIKALLDDALLSFTQINLSAPVEQLEQLTEQLDLAMETWLSMLTSVRTDVDIRVKIESLKLLLNTEQHVLGKWHSHLRLAEEVFERVTSVNSELNELNTNQQASSYDGSKESVIPSFVNNITKKFNIALTLTQYNYVLIIGLILSLILIVLMLIRVQLRLKEYGNKTVELCQSLLLENHTKAEQGNLVQSAEHLRIVGLIQQVKVPEHSKNQYQNQNLVDVNQQEATFIANHHHLVYWNYIPNKHYITDSKSVIELCGLTNQYVASWRHLFKAESVKNIISIAKNVRDSDTPMSCNVTAVSGARIDLLIDFDGYNWAGTLHKNDQVELLQLSLTKAKNRLKTVENEALEEVTATTDKFSKMILGAMLQSQGGSIDSTGASLQVYRQLTRVFDWCRQSKIVSELQRGGKETSKLTVNLKDELHAVLFNAISEAHLQRNQIYLHTDRQLMEYTQVDHRLFHRMLLGVIRITLAEFFNAKLLLDLKVIDLDNGMQTIRFTINVKTAKPIKAIPELVSRLANEDRKVSSSLDIIFYLRTLMYHLNINDIQTALSEDGFNLFFDAQFMMGRELSAITNRASTVALKHETLLLLSACNYTQQVVSDGINSIGGETQSFVSAEQFEQKYSREALENKSIKLVIIADDLLKQELHKVEAYIASLPEDIQPKLMVMQAPIGAALHKFGLYAQASAPICQKAFQQQLLELLESKNKSNQLIKPEAFKPFNYLPTRVEVLIAVAHPERHQTFIRLLQWLGMQVHVVSQAQAMIKHWESGRYLVLVTEFSQSPFILMSAGRKIHRGVFTFDDAIFDTPDGVIANTIKNWKTAKLPNILDIKALTNVFAPWLKANTVTAPQKAIEKKPKALVNKVQSFDQFLNEAGTLNDEDKAYLNDSMILLPDTSELPVDVVFDISTYALNQGSFELASYMLDDYIEDVKEAIEIIEENIGHDYFDESLKPIANIIKISEVMAAVDLKERSLALNKCIKVFMSSNENKDEIDVALKLLQVECERFITFAELV